MARAFDPALFVVDNAPRGVEGELLPTLRYLKRRRPKTRIALTLRDVLDTPENIIPLWRRLGMYRNLEALYDEIWVAGCQSVFDPIELYEMPPEVACKVKFCGYVVRGATPGAATDVLAELRLQPGPFVTVSVGGGGDGYRLIDAYVDAGLRLGRDGIRSFIFLGPDMPPSERRRLKARLLPLGDHMLTFDYRPDLITFLSMSAASVSMGGYNTVCELVSLKKSAVIVPRVHPRLEQMLRARALAQRDLLDIVHPDLLSPDTLEAAVRAAIGRAPQRESRALSDDIDFGGLRRIARRARRQLALAAGR